jgi:hypothetical protein
VGTVSRSFADRFGDIRKRSPGERTGGPDPSVPVIATVFQVPRIRRTVPPRDPEERAVRVLGTILVLAGVALLLNVTFGVVEIGPGTDRYRHEALPVTPGEDDLYTGDSPDHIDDIACLHETEAGRLCALELSLLERRPDATESTPSVVVPVSETGRADDAPFAFHQGDFYPFDGHYYERTREEGRLGLEPIGERAVFEQIAVEPDALSDPARRALAGPVSAETPLEAAGTVVETDDGYVVLESDRVNCCGRFAPLYRVLAACLQFVVGLALVVRAWPSVRDPQIST